MLSPLRSKPAEVDVYVNYGHGFPSNDVRGDARACKTSPAADAAAVEADATTVDARAETD